MTDRRDDNPMPRDPRFDAAWASASNEEPPPSLDTAILAAARREVGARPRHAETPVPEATRPERWWFPLAAAATIGAVALGLLQIVDRDGVVDDGTPAVVLGHAAGSDRGTARGAGARLGDGEGRDANRPSRRCPVRRPQPATAQRFAHRVTAAPSVAAGHAAPPGSGSEDGA